MNKSLPRVLGEYAQSDSARFHMPGHKGSGIGGFFREELALWDVTQLSMTDNLHHPVGILKETEEQYRRLYEAKRSFLSVGGSTTAVHAMILSLSRGEKLLICRDCHKSAVAGAVLSGVETEFLDLPADPETGIHRMLTPEIADKALQQTNATALFVTSPNMYGFAADIRGIAEVAHRHGALLLVDAAHASHYPFSPLLPETLGGYADIWCHSQHKTMNALTQAATLHLGECRISPETVQRRLEMLETSSPSYILLASLDWALYTGKRQDWNAHCRHCVAVSGMIDRIPGFRTLHTRDLKGAKERDVSRIVIDVTGRGLTGYDAALLLERQGIFVEMSDRRHLVLYTSPEDHTEWYTRLITELGNLPKMKPLEKERTEPALKLERILPLRAASIADLVFLDFRQSAGRISGVPVGLYPPGIADILPGEMITQEAIDRLLKAETLGAAIFGLDEGKIGVVDNIV